MEYADDITVCPFCGSGNIGDEQDESGVNLRFRTFKWKCHDCKNEWYEEYVYVRRYPESEAK